MSVAVEIAVEDEAGLVVAAHAGASRVELCTDLASGGTTPPPELVRLCVTRAAALVASRDAVASFEVHVLIRPPGGTAQVHEHPEQFSCTAEQVEQMAAQAAAAVEAGAAGVVLGALARDEHGAWALDLAALEILRDAALHAASRAVRSVQLTCHRALDALPDAAARVAAVEALVPLGFHRVLTSGGAVRAIDGTTDIAAMVEAADGLVDVCAGGGIRPADIAPLVHATGVADIHLSGRLPSGPADENPDTLTDPAVCTAAVDAAGAL